MECVLTKAFVFDAGGISMKVGTQLKAVQVKKTAQPWHEVGQLKQERNAHPSPWEDLILSSSAMQLGIQAAMRAPEIRAHRIEELRAQIETGTYEIDSTALARKILDAPNPS